jgi:hypothetical protein
MRGMAVGTMAAIDMIYRWVGELHQVSAYDFI